MWGLHRDHDRHDSLRPLSPTTTYVPKSSTRAIVRAEISKNNEAIERAVGAAIGAVVRELEAQIEQLETAMAEFAYRGNWQEGKSYRRGNFVTLGSVWHACVDTNSRPGVNSTWTMVVPKPRDGKDGKDFTPPPPPSPGGPRSVRSGRMTTLHPQEVEDGHSHEGSGARGVDRRSAQRAFGRWRGGREY